MAQDVAFSDSPETQLKSGVTVRVEIPSNFGSRQRAVPSLGYPIEVAVVANWDIPDTPTSDELPDSPPAWPRVDLLPDNGVLFWLVRGAVEFDEETEPDDASRFRPSDYVYLAPKSLTTGAAAESQGVRTEEPALSVEDEQRSWWPNARMWGRRMPLTDAKGTRTARPLYLQLYAFAGPRTDVQYLDGVLSSLQVSYE